MSRVYAIEEGSGRRLLVRLECDEPGCNARIAPHPEIVESGWIKCGVTSTRIGTISWVYCPEHAHCWLDKGLSV